MDQINQMESLNYQLYHNIIEKEWRLNDDNIVSYLSVYKQKIYDIIIECEVPKYFILILKKHLLRKSASQEIHQVLKILSMELNGNAH